MEYDFATICLNGHVISYRTANKQLFCEECGKKTFSYCPHCNSPIHGKAIIPGVVDLTGYYEKPYYCYNCGEPYPWTRQIIDHAVELASLDEELTEEDIKLIKEAIPDLIVETPTTPLAVVKYKKGISNASSFVIEGLKQILFGVLAEVAKRAIFP